MQIRKKFGEILVEAGVITEQVLETALQAQKKNGLALGRILEDMGVISDWDIATILAQQFNLEAVQHIAPPLVPERLFEAIDCDLAIKKNIFPLELAEGLLKLAISNPLDFETIDKVAFKTGLRIEPVLTTPTEIYKAIKRYYLNKASSSGNGTCNKILIVGENELYRGTICANIRKAGYEPLFGESIAEAIKLSLQENPHLILLNTAGGTASAKTLLQNLTNNIATRNRPIIALSAMSSPEEEAALLNMGFFDVVFKPVDYVRLAARIERTIRFFYHEQIPQN